MDDVTACAREKNGQVLLGDARTAPLKERLEKLLREAAEVEVELSRAEGVIAGIPHYSVIEGRAHGLGQQLSREVQQRQMRELAASQSLSAKCPGCGTRCDLHLCCREVKSVDGSLELQELIGECPCCRGAFFPDAGDVRI